MDFFYVMLFCQIDNGVQCFIIIVKTGDDGYPKGSVTLSYQTLTMGMDRGTSFQLDAMDVNESNFIASATTVSGEFQRTQVVSLPREASGLKSKNACGAGGGCLPLQQDCRTGGRDGDNLYAVKNGRV